MPTIFRIKYLITGVKKPTVGLNKFTFKPLFSNVDQVAYQDEYTGEIKSLKAGDAVEYGYRLFAGEPAYNEPTRTIVFLQVESQKNGGSWKPALTYRYRHKNEPFFSLMLKKIILFDDPPPGYDPEPDSDPGSYPDPDPESDLGNYDDTSNDDPPDADDPDDPSTGEGSDCDGTIGIAA